MAEDKWHMGRRGRIFSSIVEFHIKFILRNGFEEADILGKHLQYNVYGGLNIKYKILYPSVHC